MRDLSACGSAVRAVRTICRSMWSCWNVYGVPCALATSSAFVLTRATYQTPSNCGAPRHTWGHYASITR